MKIKIISAIIFIVMLTGAFSGNIYCAENNDIKTVYSDETASPSAISGITLLADNTTTYSDTIEGGSITIEYDLNTNTGKVTGCDDSVTYAQIPSVIKVDGEQITITAIGNYAFYEYSGLTSIEIPQGVTSMGVEAFFECNALTNVEIPQGFRSIGDAAFYGCSSLTSIEIPSSVTYFGSYAFRDCKGLTSVDIAEGVTYIGGSAFNGCSSLTSVKIPSSVTSIGNCAFWLCSSLTNIEIPSSVTSINYGAFGYCYNLTTIEIPQGVTNIGRETFWDCKNLTSIKIPSSVTSIGEQAFYNCPLEVIYYSGSKSQWEAVDKENSSIGDDVNVIFAQYKGSTVVSVPKALNGKWVHKVGIEINGEDVELTNYKEDGENYIFNVDVILFADKKTEDYEKYTAYYIYNYKDGNFDSNLKAGNYSAAPEPADNTDKEKLYIAVPIKPCHNFI